MVSLGQKLKNAKNIRKTILQQPYSCSVQKTARKNTIYSRNESILKIGHFERVKAHAKAIDLCKMVSLGQKLKILKTCLTPFHKNSTVLLCKKRLEKTPTIPEASETIFKIGHLAKAIAHAKAIAFSQWSLWVKN